MKHVIRQILGVTVIVGFLIFQNILNIFAATGGGELRIMYKGILADSEGVPMSAGKYNFKFSIYPKSDSGAVAWTEEFTGDARVAIENSGEFKVILGRASPITLDLDAATYYLTLSIGGATEEPQWDTEILPRKRLVTLTQLLLEKKKQQEAASEDALMKELLEQNIFKNATDTIIVFDPASVKEILASLKKENATISASSTTDTELLNELFASNNDDSVISKLKGFFTALFSKISSIFDGLKKVLDGIAQLNKKVDTVIALLSGNKATEGGAIASQESTQNVGNENQATTTPQQITGHIETIVDGDFILVKQEAVATDSLIFISFLENPLTEWWISERIPGVGFRMNFKNSTNIKFIKFDYWLMSKSITPEDNSNNQESVPESMSERTTTTTITTSEQAVPIESSNKPLNNIQAQEGEPEVSSTSNQASQEQSSSTLVTPSPSQESAPPPVFTNITDQLGETSASPAPVASNQPPQPVEAPVVPPTTEETQ